jgi:hypothetical protein
MQKTQQFQKHQISERVRSGHCARTRYCVPDQDEHLCMSSRKSKPWWPAALGTPSTFGTLDTLRYAYFPEIHRLAVVRIDDIVLYDTADHHFRGAWQDHGETIGLSFASQRGRVLVSSLTQIFRAAAWPDDVGTALSKTAA